MRANAISAIIFSNSNDEALKELTENRSMSSVPFGCRYRLIDFTLSNLVNAGISNVGVITNENYRSLMDHIGSGIYWDLDRKNGGLNIIPPFMMGENKYSGLTETCFRAYQFASSLNSEHIIVSESGIIANIDITALINKHIEKNADITFVYRKAECPDKFKNTLKFDIIDEQIRSTSKAYRLTESGNYSMGLAVFKKSAFIDLINLSKNDKDEDVFAKLISENISNYKMFGFEHRGFVAPMDSKKSFYENNMRLFDENVRNDLFNKERPILTKPQDEAPVLHQADADVRNSIISAGCRIEGRVENSIIFRSVNIGKKAVIKNSVIMMHGEVGDGVVLDRVIADKYVQITGGVKIYGTKDAPVVIGKNKKI